MSHDLSAAAAGATTGVSPAASYHVQIDWAPAYELHASLFAYLSRRHHRVLDLGPGWAAEVRRRLRPEFASELAAAQPEDWSLPPEIMVLLCPAAVRDADDFIGWLESLHPGDVYELLAPRLLPTRPSLPRDLGAKRDRAVSFLARWNEQYFRGVDPAVLAGLAADAEDKRGRLRAVAATATAADGLPLSAADGSRVEAAPVPPDSLELVAFVERTTVGCRLEAGDGRGLVVLVPQYHFRPFNVYQPYRELAIDQYPSDAFPPAPGEPPPRLRRMARALGDESRLRLLRFLARGPRTFTDVQKFTGLSKSTVHHHLMALRVAGLVRVHFDPTGGDRCTYSLRPDSLEELRAGLAAYLGE